MPPHYLLHMLIDSSLCRDDLREHLKNAQRMIMAQKQEVSSSDTDSDSDSNSSM